MERSPIWWTYTVVLQDRAVRGPKVSFLKRAWDRTLGRSRGDETNLNHGNVALSIGNFDLATQYAAAELSIKWASRNRRLAATFLSIRVRSRQYHFAEVLDDLENLFEKVPRSNSNLKAKIGNEILWVAFRSDNLGLGAQRGEVLYAKYKEEWPEVEIVELLCQLSSCHFLRGDLERAEELIKRALEVAHSSKSPKALAQSSWQLSTLAIGRGDMPTSLAHSREARTWAQIGEMDHILPVLNNNAASIMLELPDQNLSEIHELAEAAYLELIAQNDPGFAAYACVNLSEVELRRNDFKEAMRYVEKGLSELPAEVSGPRISLYIQKAKILARTNQYVESEGQANIALELMRRTEPSTFLSTSWAHLARVFVEAGLPDRGVFAYEKALQIAGVIREEPEDSSEAELKETSSNHI